MSRYIHSCTGFTLIEVMIAISILSVGILSVTNMQMTSIRINASSNKLTTALMISQALVEELMSLDLDDERLVDETREGIFTPYNFVPMVESSRGLSHEYDIYKGFNLRWEVDNKGDGTKTINVITTWQGINEEKKLVLPLQRSKQQSID